MEKIKIKKDNHGDSRQAPKDTTFEQFHRANVLHRRDIKNVLNYLSFKLSEMGKAHDWTKISQEKLFWKEFWSEDFINGEWYQMHVHTEKHHPTSYCHDDINLLDIIEMIADCVCAGKARSGEIRQLEINEDILKKAFDNTVRLIDEITTVED